MSSNMYYTDDGGLIHVAKRIGSGGEGDIYSLKNNNKNCAKLYTKAEKLSEDNYEKVVFMINNPPDDPTIKKSHPSLAWPIKLIYQERKGKTFAGFIMPLIPTIEGIKFDSILNYFHPSEREHKFPGFTWKHLLTTSLNLASAVAAMHERGYIIGDINESNFLVHPTSLVSIIDCDSFQVTDPKSGKVWKCLVGKDQYRAPELLKSSIHKNRSLESDYFALSVLIFQLLMQGWHPYAATGKLVDDTSSPRGKIIKGIFPYGRRRSGISPPPEALPFEILHPTIQTLFMRCFEKGHADPKVRPSSKEWWDTLRKLGKELRKCPKNENHFYFNHLNKCPWCDIKKNTRKDPFQSLLGQQIRMPSSTEPLEKRTNFLCHYLIELALSDGYISKEEEDNIFERGKDLHIPEKEIEKLIADELRKRGISGVSGSARLVVDKSHIEFKDMKISTNATETIEVSNVGDGIMTGTISSNARWLRIPSAIAPCRKNQSQKIQVTVDTSNLPYGFSGSATMSIKTTGGTADIAVNLTTEGLSHLVNDFRSQYVPLSAAVGGFLFSFGYGPDFAPLGIAASLLYAPTLTKQEGGSLGSIVKATIVAGIGSFIIFAILEWVGKYFPHFIGFVIGAYLIGGLAYLCADLIMKHVLNAGMNLSRFPPILVHGLSAGLVILAIAFHSGDSTSVKRIAEREMPTRQAQSQRQRIVSPPTTTKSIPAPRVRIKRSVVAEEIDNNKPVGVNTKFPVNESYGNTRRTFVVYYAEYEGASPNKTEFNVKFIKEGKVIGTSQYRCNKSVKQYSGNYWCKTGPYYLSIGDYEACLYVDGKMIDRKNFSIVPRDRRQKSVRTSIPKKTPSVSSTIRNKTENKPQQLQKTRKLLIPPPSRDSF